MADLTKVMRFEHDGTEYSWSFSTDMTGSFLRHVKSWFGTDLGRYLTFQSAVLQGDPDAWACLVWGAKRKAGETGVTEPRNLNVNVGALLESLTRLNVDDDDELEQTVDPIEPPSSLTEDSTRTTRSSEPSISPGSRTTSGSPDQQSTSSRSSTS